MSALLDTHVALWFVSRSDRLGPATREWLLGQSALCVSAASLWEVAIKRRLGKLTTADDLPELFVRSGLTLLPVSAGDAWEIARAADLPHGDPLDRMLVSQARSGGRVFVTADQQILSADLGPAPVVRDARA